MRMTKEFEKRFQKHYEELKSLYFELYENRVDMFESLCEIMRQFYKNRDKDWKVLDRKREKNSNWYRGQDILGMMLYIDAFNGNIFI